MHGPRKLAVRIETDSFFPIEKVVVRVAVEQGADGDHDQAFLAVGNEHPGVNRADGLCIVFGLLQAEGVDTQRAGQGDAGGVFGADVSALAER